MEVTITQRSNTGGPGLIIEKNKKKVVDTAAPETVEKENVEDGNKDGK